MPIPPFDRGLTARQQIFSLLNDGSTAAWYQPGIGITGTLTASAWADQSGNGRDLAQGTGGNQPIVLPWTGANYAWFPDAATDYLSTPSATANQITSGLDIDAEIYLSALASSGGSALHIIGKWSGTGNNYSYIFQIQQSTGKLLYSRANTGLVGNIESAVSDSAALTSGTRGFVRVTELAGVVTFYTSSDGVTWTPLGATKSVTNNTIFAGTAPLWVGVNQDLTTQRLPSGSRLYGLRIYNGIRSSGGTLAVNLDPSRFTETTTNGATAVMATGETFTLNNTGAKPAQIVGSSQLLFDGSASYMKASAFTLNQPITYYAVFKRITNIANERLIDGNTATTVQVIRDNVNNYYIRAGSNVIPGSPTLALNTYGIFTAVFNGASSLFAFNTTTTSPGDAGATNAGGLTIGAQADGGNPGNHQWKELIVRAAADSAATRLAIQTQLNRIHSVY